MGIDAEMFVRLDYKISDEELQRKSYIFGSMCKQVLFLGYDKNHVHDPLEKVEVIHGDGTGYGYEFFTDETHDIIRIPLAGRYYGPGYERGPLMDYVAVAMFLEELLPNQEIWYGGDSSGVEFVLFNDSYRKELIMHAVANGHDPYSRYMAFDKDKETGPDCPYCKASMIKNGAGPKMSFYSCIGCGWNVKIQDDKKEEGYAIKVF